MAADSTARKQRGVPFKPGQSGNPKGRPLGSKQKLAEDFVAALAADFEAHGIGVVQIVRQEKPDQYTSDTSKPNALPISPLTSSMVYSAK